MDGADRLTGTVKAGVALGFRCQIGRDTPDPEIVVDDLIQAGSAEFGAVRRCPGHPPCVRDVREVWC